MKKMIVFVLCIGNFLYVLTQQNLGIRNNYAGIQGRVGMTVRISMRVFMCFWQKKQRTMGLHYTINKNKTYEI
jgi:hypothetical protein